MSHKRKPGFEIVHSGTWWKEFHEAWRAHAARSAQAAKHPSNNANVLTGNVYTFAPGCAAPFVQVAGAPHTAQKLAPSFSAARIASTKNALIVPRGSNSILACCAREEHNLLVQLARNHVGCNAALGIGSTDDVAVRNQVWET
jgi:hypothetical protein